MIFDGMTFGEAVAAIQKMSTPREQAEAILEAATVVEADDEQEGDYDGCCSICGHIPEFCDCDDGPSLP